MANHFMCHLTRNLFFLLSYTSAVIVAASTLPQPNYSQHYTTSDYPQPHEFANERIYQAYFVIQRFKKTISCDPKNITSTWAGHDICGDKTYVGFYCSALPSRRDNNLTVTSVVLNGFGLCAPKLQDFIYQLPDLAVFQATSNKFGAFDVLNLRGLTYQYKLDINDDQPAQPQQRDFDLPTKKLFYLSSCVSRACITLQSSESLVAIPVPRTQGRSSSLMTTYLGRFRGTLASLS
jgi:hypothetical protein